MGVNYTPLREVGYMVRCKEPFRGSTIYGAWYGALYVVYSYGQHFPIYVWDPHVGWIGNTNKYSQTTSRHQNAARPTANLREMETEDLRRLISAGGYVGYAKLRVEGAQHVDV